MSKEPTVTQIRRVVKAFRSTGGSVSDALSRLPDEYRKIFSPNLMLAICYALIVDTPRWRFIRRYRIKQKGLELEAVIKPDFVEEFGSGFRRT